MIPPLIPDDYAPHHSLMQSSPLSHMFDAMTWVDLALWTAVFAVILVGIVLFLRAEKRQYDRRGKGQGWLWMRLLALPMLAATAAAIVVPARSIAGPEALAAFYIALFTLGPLVWFGLHLLAGALQSPRFTRGESTGLAVSGLAILIVPPLIVGMAQGPIFMVSNQMKARGFEQAEQAPLPHTLLPVQRFRLNDAGELYTQTLRTPAGLHIERVSALIGDHWSDTATMTHAYLCRQGDDLHLAWPVGSQLMPLRIHWRDNQNSRYQAEYRVDTASLAALPPQAFTVAWRDDGIDLPVPLARELVQLGWRNAPDALHYRSLHMLQPGETFKNDCVMAGYRRVAWQQEGPIAGVILRFNPPPPTPPWQAEFHREAEMPSPSAP